MQKLKVYAFSHIGNSRSNQEDNYLIGGQYLSAEQVRDMSVNRKLQTSSLELSSDYCAAVSDGMGGYEGGEIASLMTVKYLSEHYNEFIEEAKDSRENITKFITRLNNYVCSEAKKLPETVNMGAALCGVISSENHIYGFNVGDSRLYHYADGVLKQITVDNTEGQRLFDLGLLSADEVKSFPKKKSIYKYIGKNTELISDIYEINNITKGNLLLLCSDGLSDVLTKEEIQDVLSKRNIVIGDKGKFLVEIAAERNIDAGDNITLIIIEY